MIRSMKNHRLRMLIILLSLTASFTSVWAQQVHVNITRRQNPLPPQVATYYENPGRFFNVSVTNGDPDRPIPIRLELSLVGPIEGGADAWPAACSSFFTLTRTRNIPSSFILAPRQTRHLTGDELNQHLRSYPMGSYSMGGAISEAIQTPKDGRPFGLLDEGHYGLRFVVKTNYEGESGDVIGEGECYFDICYSASSPEFTFPRPSGFDFSAAYDVVNFPTDYAHFEWTSPRFNLATLTSTRQFSFDFKLYRMLANQSPEEAISSNGIAFQQQGLMTPFCDIPKNVVDNLQRSGTQYFVAQVTARPVVSDTNNPDYTLINNKGASQYMVLKLGSEGSSGGIENDLVNDAEKPTDEFPIKVTIEPKFTTLTNELEPYFSEPGSMFRITLENTASEDHTISMLLQFFKDNWGVSPSPNKQHSTRSLTIPAGQTISLSDEQVNELAGGYAYADVIAFKAKTGFIIGSPSQSTFPDKDYTVSARICQFTGKPVLREKVIGKARADFSTSGEVEPGAVFNITLEARMNPMPTDSEVYFTKPSRLFTATIENLSTLSYTVCPRLLVRDYEGDAYGGVGYTDRINRGITIAPGQIYELTGDQFDELCGGFTQARRYANRPPVPSDTVLLAEDPNFLGLDGSAMAELSLYDATTLRTLYGKDADYATKSFLQAQTVDFETSLKAFIGDIDVSISCRKSDMPSNASAYFMHTHHLFDVVLTNMGSRPYTVSPVLKYKMTDEDDILAACIPGWHKQTITLQPGQRYTLSEDDHKRFFGSNRAIRCVPDGEGRHYVTSDTIELYKNLDNFLDDNLSVDELSFAHIDVYDASIVEHLKEIDFGELRPALVGQCGCSYTIALGSYLHDVNVSITPLLDPMPGNGKAYIEKTANLYELKFTNTTSRPIRCFPIIRYNFKDEVYTYAPAIEDLHGEHIVLQPDRTTMLTQDQVLRFLSGTKGVRYTGDAEPDTLDTFDDLIDFADINLVGIAVVDIDTVLRYDKKNTPDFEARAIRGWSREPFNADPAVVLDDIVVTIGTRILQLPENGEPYVQTPGRLFDISLTNTLDREVKVKPMLLYRFTDGEGETFEPHYANGEVDEDAYITIAAKATRKLTTSEINKYCGGTVLLHHQLDADIPDTVTVFSDLVRLDADNQLTFMALDYDLITEGEEEAPDYMEKLCLGEGEHTFRGVEGVKLDQVSVILKQRMDPMPANGLYYARTPGRLFDITLVNNSLEELVVLPVLEYYFDEDESYYTIDFRSRNDKPLFLKPEEQRVLTPSEINRLCGGAQTMCYYPNASTALCDTIKDLKDIVSEELSSIARLVVYDGGAIDVAYTKDASRPLFDPHAERAALQLASDEVLFTLSNGRLGSQDVHFYTSKDVAFGDVEVKITPKATMSDQAEPYFTEPGKYFDVTFKNVGFEESTFGLRLTLNNRYYGVSDSLFTLPPDSAITLTEEQLNNLCGGIAPERIVQIDTVDNVIQFNRAKDMQLLDGKNTVQALVWDLPKEDKLNEQGTNADTLALSSASFVGSFHEVKIGEFILTIEESQRAAQSDSCYSGNGYITWNAMGFPIRIAVEFDTLYINKESVAYRGLVKSAKKKELNFVPYDLFEGKLDSLNNEELGTELKAMLAGSEFAQYYRYATETLDAIPMTFVEGAPALALPLKLPQSVSEKSPVDIQLISMEFRPDRANMNLMAQFTLPETNYVNTAENILVFGAPHLGMSDSTLIPKTGDLALLTDLTIKDPSTGFNITFLSPKSVEELSNNGCYVAWEDGEFRDFVVDAKMAIPSEDILKDVDGTVTEGVAPDIRLTARIADKEDWIGQIRMDAFQLKDAPGYSFTLAGPEVGIAYDHSKKAYPDGFTRESFPKEYDWAAAGINASGSDDQKLREWQGFYFEKLSVTLPPFIELDDSGEDKQLALGIEKVIYDDSGFTCSFYGQNVFDQHTTTMGGWRMSLDEVNLSIIQNDFSNFGMNGKFEVPLLEGEIGYEAKVFYADKSSGALLTNQAVEGQQTISAEEVQRENKAIKVIFETRPVDSLSLDFFVGTMDFQKDETYFNLTYFDEDTDVELCLGATINIAGSKSAESAAAFALPGIEVHNMRLANFKSEKTIEGNAYHFESQEGDFCFDLGRWSLGGIDLGGSQPQQAGNQAKQAGGAGNQAAQAGAAQAGKAGAGAGGEKQQEQEEEAEGKKVDSDVEYGLNIAGFAIGLEEFSVTTGTGKRNGQIGLYVNAKMGLMEMVSAKTGITIWAAFDMEKKSAEYKGTEFESVGVEASIAGMYLSGTLAVSNDQERGEGYAGDLNITLPGELFTVAANGGYYRKEHEVGSGHTGSYSWGYFGVAMGGKAMSTLQPISISEVSGGFYFNCKTTGKTDRHGMPEVLPAYDVIGAKLGVGLTAGSEGAIAGKFDLLFFYDSEKDKMSRIQLTGQAHVLGGSVNKSGAINAQAVIIYENTIDNKSKTGRKYLQLSVTADGKASMDDMAKKMIENYVPAEFNGVKATLQEAFGQDEQDLTDAGAKKSKEKNTGQGMVAKAEAYVNMDFLVEFVSPTNPKDVKWHLWIGKPQPESDRCRITFIDFQIGDKEDPVAMWAKVWANAYFCIGNDLPVGNDGKILPPIPTEVQEFLDGEGLDGKSQAGTSSRAQSLREETLRSLLQSGTNGGMMFGASAGATLGANMLIAYFDATMIGGFDLALVKLAGGTPPCSNTGRPMRGINGYYATGQMYALLKGDIGLMIDLWLFKGKISLVEAGLGALLQVGFAHPTWVYGKARAKCSLFNGLVKFNQAIEIEAGDVCVPYYANPMQDIQIFADTYPNYESKNEGWANDKKISAYATPRFTTNMPIGVHIRLLDETINAQLQAQNYDTSGEGARNAERTYVFRLGRMTLDCYQNKNGAKDGEHSLDNVQAVSTSGDQENFTLKTGSLEPNRYYRATLRGYAKEIVNGREVNPRFCDESTNYKTVSKAWEDSYEFYFATKALPEQLTAEDVAFARPGKPGMGSTYPDKAYYDEVEQPRIALTRSRSDLLNVNGKTVVMRLMAPNPDLGFVGFKQVGTDLPVREVISTVGRSAKYVTWTTNSSFNISAMKADSRYWDRTWKLQILRIDNAKYDKYLKDAKESIIKESIQYGRAKDRDGNTIATPAAGAGKAQNGQMVDLGAIFAGFEGAMVTERQKDQIETKVKEFELNASMADFTEVLAEFNFTIRPYENMAAHMRSLNSSGKLASYARVNPDSRTKEYNEVLDIFARGLIVSAYNIVDRHNLMNASFTDLQVLFTYGNSGYKNQNVFKAYTNPYTTFLFWSDLAWAGGTSMGQYLYDRSVPGGRASTISAQWSVSRYGRAEGGLTYLSMKPTPTYSGTSIFPFRTKLEGGVLKSNGSSYNTQNIDRSKTTHLYTPKDNKKLNTTRVIYDRMQNLKPVLSSSSAITFDRSDLTDGASISNVFYSITDLLILDAVAVYYFVNSLNAKAREFKAAAVTSGNYGIDANKARTWASTFGNHTITGGSYSASLDGYAYQIPYCYGIYNRHVSEAQSKELHLRMPEIITQMSKPFYPRAFIRGIKSISFRIARPNVYNIYDYGTNSGYDVESNTQSTNTYNFVLSNPYDKKSFRLSYWENLYPILKNEKDSDISL